VNRGRGIRTLCDRAAGSRHTASDGVEHARQQPRRPPAGLSPADPQWDPFYSLLEDAGLALLVHIGGGGGFVARGWGAAPLLSAQRMPGGDPAEALGPMSMMTLHLAPHTYLTALVMGGVLERHPRLRVGFIELGALWAAHWCELADEQADRNWKRRFAGTLSLKPSDYVRRQVRVTPFYKEPTATLIERHGFEDVVVFSTDFPHTEGGTDPIGRFHADVARLGERVVEKFFVGNGEFLLPG
jgi:predicted TIM-barrel fold metal-dependent hydrolase